MDVKQQHNNNNNIFISVSRERGELQRTAAGSDTVLSEWRAWSTSCETTGTNTSNGQGMVSERVNFCFWMQNSSLSYDITVFSGV